MNYPRAGTSDVWNWLKRQIKTHLIEPFKESHAPVSHITRGATIGMFVALTPTVGAQMYISGAVWVICRYMFRYRFNLPIAIAMVWITNPITTPPIYYGYYLIGDYLLSVWGKASPEMTYDLFVQMVVQLSDGEQGNLIQRILAGLYVLLREFGWPLLLGSLLVTLPVTVATYPVTWSLMTRYRKRLASQAGLSYEDWKAKFVRPE